MPKEHYRLNERFESRDMNNLVRAANRTFAKLERRLDSLERVNAKTPPNIKDFTVEGKQGTFHLAWKKIIGVDGYIVLVSSDSGMIKITNRFDIPGQETCTWSIAVGNASFTRYFQLFTYIGKKTSNGSIVQSATSANFGSSEAVPAAPTFDPKRPGGF